MCIQLHAPEAICYDYKGNAYKPGETYIELEGGRTW